jgi:hypothetical protein
MLRRRVDGPQKLQAAAAPEVGSYTCKQSRSLICDLPSAYPAPLSPRRYKLLAAD